ncbi:hypothetical protein JB92DRAFT_2838095 [Gautieria morchelliformis]|nr:hypothetical protein JB92DRAFT_2838095 [Gautieria morchelliformis]
MTRHSHGLKYHLAHSVCCFAPRDPAVEALRRASGGTWKGRGCVQWTGTSMGESRRGGEEKKGCERRYKILTDCMSGTGEDADSIDSGAAGAGPSTSEARWEPRLLPAQAAAACCPCAVRAVAVGTCTRTRTRWRTRTRPRTCTRPRPSLRRRRSGRSPAHRGSWRAVWCVRAAGHEKRKADMSMTVMCLPSATGPHGANASWSWWWW